ncbi:dermonecrotic toxin domain-containing protein [Pseudomonas viridiflava]|uniref:dermonecrotic toxin domain-containing protein n=1 Tax=Pseudomonas viridiflava TaxID=33069 RepID=UPI000F01BBDD|nr:DUF6543 domain-containing protein [Pseudomonas viridiflava]
MPASPPYFFSESLRSQFASDVKEAADASRITAAQRDWLTRLADTEGPTLPDSALPRVDKLVLSGTRVQLAELAGALLISDPVDSDAPVFLSTLLLGIESFDSRVSLLAALKKRFPELDFESVEIDAEHVQTPLFETQARLIMIQQAAHLESLSGQLHALPDLQSVLGQGLSARLQALSPEFHVDVVSHPVQLVDTANSMSIVGVQRLDEVVLDEYVSRTLPTGLKRQYLDARGRMLSDGQVQRCTNAISQTIKNAVGTYEQSLTDFWASTRSDGQAVRDVCVQALTESFRQHLLSSRSNGSLSTAEFRRLRCLIPSCGTSPQSESIRLRRLSVVVGSNEPVKLTGLFMIDFEQGEPSGVYLYSFLRGFRHFADSNQVQAYLSHGQGRSDLLLFSSLNDQPLIEAPGQVELHSEAITAALFPHCLDLIIALQKRSLRYTLGLATLGHARTPVRVDDALDIRVLLDARLTGLHGPGRWRSGESAFERIWQTSTAAVHDVSFESLGTWAGKLEKMELLFREVSLLHPGVDGCMRSALNFYLALVGDANLDSRELRVASLSGDEDSMPLLSWALGRVCGHSGGALTGALVMGGEPPPSPRSLAQSLPVTIIEEMVNCVLADFASRYERQIDEFYAHQTRYLNTYVKPGAVMRLVREYDLRLELTMQRRLGKVSGPALDSLEQVLNRPLPALRQELGQARVEAYTVSARYGSPERRITLPNMFVLCKPQQGDHQVIWSPTHGLRGFDSREALKAQIVLEMTSLPITGLRGLLSEPDRQAMLEYLNGTSAPDVRIDLQLISGHFIEALQEQEIERQQRTITSLYQQAVERQLTPTVFSHLLNSVERDDTNRHALNHLGVIIQSVVYQTIVPQWISDASTQEQVVLIDILQRFYVTCVAQNDFLFGIPSLYEYSRRQLILRLMHDFPEQAIEPGDITVTLTHYIPAPVPPGQINALPAATERVSESLVEYAVNRFMSRQDGVLTLAANNGKTLDPSLTAAYVRDMADSLDVAKGYRRLLGSKLVESDPDYLTRKKLFSEQMPATGLLSAFTSTLRKELSEDAFVFINHVLNMPDGLARLPAMGREVMISPLCLLPATEGWAPTTVINTYIIGPAEPSSTTPGPWVLYAPLNGDFVFREYANRDGLLNDIRTSESFQAFILDRIEPDQRKIFDNGGFMEPHLPFSVESSFDLPLERPQPVTLQVRPYKGNALDLLFEGTLQSLTLQVQQQTVTSDELRSTATRYLFGLAAEQVMALLPGRLGALVGVLQGQSLLSRSAASAGEQHWGQAVAEFMAALCMLISSGLNVQIDGTSNLDDDAGDQSTQLEPEAEEEEPGEVPPFPEFSWSNNSLTQQIRTRLRQFEVHDVALESLHKDELFNTYNDPVSGKKYAAIDGNAYELRSDRDGWFIASKDVAGPPVVLDKDQRWRLDLQMGLKGGGGIVTRLKNSQLDISIDEALAVDSSGMLDIRRTFRGMALAIEEGHAQAQRYLENCLDNLRLRLPDNAVDSRAQKIVGEFFGTGSPDARTYDVVRQSVTKLYSALMDPTLSPIDSPRFVVGVNRVGREDCSAFVFEADPQKRIFLTEQFFRLPAYRFKMKAMRSGSFHFGAHYRAAILIHELSHQVLKTEDIAYVDSQAPFIDLLEDTAGYRLRIRNQQIALQQKVLSYQTDRSQLFKQLENGLWRDLKRADGDGKKTILHITGKKTLDEARDVFYADVDKRTDIMLGNADSLALLVTLLGRERFAR